MPLRLEMAGGAGGKDDRKRFKENYQPPDGQGLLSYRLREDGFLVVINLQGLEGYFFAFRGRKSFSSRAKKSQGEQ